MRLELNWNSIETEFVYIETLLKIVGREGDDVIVTCIY